eukprot:TRINITY_DN3160_c0_g1_i1.p4 TRINITY_DN3160_c0_g1~~TRINITY_DN3160_c0_g1_i1.p4  ORF type:complete len:189 (+),score=67.42 TRINITY_DN3160_c0_g1_i1:855-1421(+)
MMYVVVFLFALLNITSARKLNVFDGSSSSLAGGDFQSLLAQLQSAGGVGGTYGSADAFAALATSAMSDDFFADGAFVGFGSAGSTGGGTPTATVDASLVSTADDDSASTVLQSITTADADGEGAAIAASVGAGEAAKKDGSSEASFYVAGVDVEVGDVAEATVVSDGEAYVTDDTALSTATVCAGSDC